MLETFNIDEEFRTLIPPLTIDEFELLEANIVEKGVVIQPLTIWNNTIVDGHNRYKILQKYPDIKYETYQRLFENRYEAMAWICKNQLGRRNLSAAQKTILMGRRYQAEKDSHGASNGFRGNQHAKVVTH